MLPYLTVVIAAFAPLAAGIYLLVSTAWSLAERRLFWRITGGSAAVSPAASQAASPAASPGPPPRAAPAAQEVSNWRSSRAGGEPWASMRSWTSRSARPGSAARRSPARSETSVYPT